MPRRGGQAHVATIKTKGKGGTVYTSYLLRRSYREDGKVKHENLGNLSHLPLDVIDAIRAMLAGRRLVDLDESFEIERSSPHGHVAAVLGVLRSLDVERLLARERCRERDLCVAMICQLVIGPCSKLSMTRRFSQTTLVDELELGEVTEPELLGAMDWLLDRQDRVEKTLARRHLTDGGFVLYDLSSSYVEGRCCELAALGHSRDGKPGTLQVNWGLVCSPEGRPVAVQVHPGNTADPTTVPGVLDTIKQKFGIDRVILVGDRAMITDAHAQAIKELGAGFVSALKSAQIRKLIDGGELQLSLFDETNLAEISSPEFPGERLVVCRNPQLQAERARKREDLLAATERELDKVRQMVSGPRGSLRHADAGKIGQRAGRTVNKYKLAKHFDLQIADGSFSYQRKTDQIAAEAALDGIYVIRTTCPTSELTTQAVVRVYKQLKMAERAYRTIKNALDVRPIRHHLQDRVQAHFFLFLLAYHLLFELQHRLAPMLHTDDTPLAPADPVAPARRSPAANKKASSHRTPDGLPTYDLTDLIAELGTVCRNHLRITDREHTFPRLTNTNPTQAKALALLDIKLAA
ncbi:MAG TPA: IS1634 family transposase [Thermoanaerobaculaceae bacterium]|nr:IS1634 family transposase [Thermoanaerobaculaceae bacterium]